MTYETVLYDVAEHICTVTLNRPEKLNAWTRQMHFDLKDAMQKAGADPDVRVIVLTGAGRGFCAGADMGGLQAIGAGASADRSTKAGADLPGGSTLAEFRMNYSTSRRSRSSSSPPSTGRQPGWASSSRSTPTCASPPNRRCSPPPSPSAA